MPHLIHVGEKLGPGDVFSTSCRVEIGILEQIESDLIPEISNLGTLGERDIMVNKTSLREDRDIPKYEQSSQKG